MISIVDIPTMLYAYVSQKKTFNVLFYNSADSAVVTAIKWFFIHKS